jgi:hypothetical protein
MIVATMSGPDQREMYTEIGALIGAIAEAFGLSHDDAARAVEQSRITLGFARDSNGNPYVDARYEGRSARIYQGAIKRERTKPE